MEKKAKAYINYWLYGKPVFFCYTYSYSARQ